MTLLNRLTRSSLPVLAITTLTLAGANEAQATTFDLTTDFTEGTVSLAEVTNGNQPSAANNSLSSEFESFANFGVVNGGVSVEAFDGTPNLGSLVFVNSGPFYFTGNRAYGFAGPGRSDITFNEGVTAIELEVRGSDGQTSGANSITIPGSTTFGASDVTVLIWTEVGVQSVTNDISNTGFQNISLDVSTVPGDRITRVSLINQAGAEANSVAFIGEITLTVPEPGTGAIALGSLLLIGMRRRRRA